MIDQESGGKSASGNVFTGAGSSVDGSDRIGVDGAAGNGPVTGVASTITGQQGRIGAPSAGAYGTITLNPDGSYAYALDQANPAVASLDPTRTLTEVFAYTITDADGSTSEAELRITIRGMTPPSHGAGPWIPPSPTTIPDRGIGQGYSPGLFILPAVHSLQGELVEGEEVRSGLFRITEDMDSAQFVLREGVGYSRGLLNEIHSQHRVSPNDFDHRGSRLLWDDFSPFSIKRFLRESGNGERDRADGDNATATVVPLPLPPAIVVPGPAAAPAGADSLSARLAVLAQASALPLPSQPTVARQ